MTCAEIDELAGAIALDAIPDEEWPAIRAHLADCARGHPEIRDFRRVAALLLEAAPAAETPAGLRGRILTAARAEAAAGAATPAATSGGGVAPVSDIPEAARRHAPAEAEAPAGNGTMIRRTDRAWWARPGWAAAAAALLVAVAMTAWNLSLRTSLDDKEDQLAAARRQAARQEQALAVLTGHGQQVRFASTLTGASGSVLRPEDGPATLVVDGLPRTPGKTYQVWAIQGDRPISLGVFNPDEGGAKVVTLDHDLHNVDAVAISVEPGPDGSPKPTTAPFMVAALRG